MTATDDTSNAIIIGAGPAGLTAALELLRHTDIHPIVVEQLAQVGGIARTIVTDGNRMDLGGHRFFTKSKEIEQWWDDIMPRQHTGASTNTTVTGHDDNVMLLRHRISRILYRHHLIPYPVTLCAATLRGIGLRGSIAALAGFVRARLRHRQELSLQDFYINRFGEPLYRTFFEQYTRKVWGKSPDELSADWGAQRTGGMTLATVMRKMLARLVPFMRDTDNKSLITKFLYPKYGPGQMWQLVARQIQEKGGDIILNATAETVHTNKGRVTAVTIARNDGTRQRVACDHLLSSMPLRTLIPALSGISLDNNILDIAARLPYRDFITIALLIEQPEDAKEQPQLPDTWIYCQEPDLKLGRIQVFNNWSPHLVADPKRHLWLGLEYFCAKGDGLWQMSDGQLKDMAHAELLRTGLVPPPARVTHWHIERVEKAYPAYYGSYEHISQLKDALSSIPNLYCIGRNGQHRYNNMDHSMLTAIKAVQAIASGITDKAGIWNVNTDQTYQESS